VWAILNRHGCSRVRAERRESVRYEWPCPGDLVHVDVKRYPRFRRPGHAVIGNRSKTGWDNRHLMGWDYFHAMFDDHSRLAYGELLADEKATTVTAFFERPGRLCRSRHPGPARDDRRCVVLHPQPLAARVLYRPRDPPHQSPRLTPRAGTARSSASTRPWNASGAKGLRYRNSQARNQALPHWLSYYNERRLHSALNGRPPISRAHNLSGQDS
jgi:hypothetical protein